MKTENKKILDDALSILKGFGIKESEIVLTGSLALDAYGLLPETHKVHDFDCFVLSNSERAKKLDTKITDFVNESGGKIESSRIYDEEEADILFFNLFGKEINIWFISDNSIKTDITYNGLKIRKPNEIIKQKLKYDRTKDYKDVLDIVRLLTEKK